MAALSVHRALDGRNAPIPSSAQARSTRARSNELAACAEDGIGAFLPSRALCTDNAAMVAAAGHWRLVHGDRSRLDLAADPNLRLFSTV